MGMGFMGIGRSVQKLERCVLPSRSYALGPDTTHILHREEVETALSRTGISPDELVGGTSGVQAGDGAPLGTWQRALRIVVNSEWKKVGGGGGGAAAAAGEGDAEGNGADAVEVDSDDEEEEGARQLLRGLRVRLQLEEYEEGGEEEGEEEEKVPTAEGGMDPATNKRLQQVPLLLSSYTLLPLTPPTLLLSLSLSLSLSQTAGRW